VNLFKLSILGVLMLTACVTANQMFVPTDTVARSPKPMSAVVLLDKEPASPYITIGIITPPPDEYESVAEALNAARKVAASKGADAIIIESAEQTTQQGFDVGILGAKSETNVLVNARIKAIVWK
jgi:hypothetical protein